MLQRRRDGDAASGGTDADAVASGGTDAAAAEPGVSPALADERAADVVAAASSAGDGVKGEGQGLQLIGQELVPVSEPKRSEKAVEDGQKERTPEEQFASPKVQRPLGNSPEQLQIENTPFERTNEQSSQKGSAEENSMAVVPNGPPKTFAPPGTPSLPLFTPEQVQQMNDAQTASSMLPFGRQAGLGVELPRLPAVLQHLLPGLDQVHALQEQRQRELEWRVAMESRMEQLGLQLRASQNENCRLREELNEVKRDTSRYGTPEEKPQAGWEVLEVGKFEDRLQKGQGQVAAVSQLVPPVEASIVKVKPSKEERVRARKTQLKEDGVATQQVLRKEDGVVTQQVLRKEDGVVTQQDSRKEDGVVTQQAPKKEDGAETRQDFMQSPSHVQDESEDEQSSQSQDSEQGLGGERHRGAQRSKEGDPTMQVLLKIVDTMQVMQRSMLKSKEEIGEEPEVVRVSPQLPKLPEWCPESAPIDFNDWLTCLEVHMSDLSSNSQHWWEATMKVVSTWYAHHMTLTPIQRLSHVPELPDHLKQRKWARLEKRAASLLMASIPETLREEVVASKAVSTHGIMSKAMLVYQPGGLGERGAILQALESPQESATISTAITQLRKWIRWKRRACEMGVSIPDASILMRGLSRLMKKLLNLHPDLNFRLSLVRNSLLVDTVPTLDSVNKYSEHLLAELEQMGHQAKKKEVATEVVPKIKRLEETSKQEEKPRFGGKLNEEQESKKKPCRFFLTETGCKRGRACQFGHVPDGERRCWACGAKDHMANNCKRGLNAPEETKPRVSKVASKSVEKEGRSSSSTSSPEKPEEQNAESEKGDDTMKVLIDEANRMLRSLQETDPKEKTMVTKNSEDKMSQLQKQLDEMKKITLRPFRLSRVGCSSLSGLLDSGATHPLRPAKKNEKLDHYPKVQVTLAGDQQVTMSLAPTGVIIGGPGAEPIVPMGLLTKVLNCKITWDGEALQVLHPTIGLLDVVIKEGCPMVSQDLALKLIEEIESVATVVMKAFNINENPETEWIKRLVHEHPVFRDLPPHLQQALVETPASNILPLGNRRMRKLWKKHGALVHLFSGENAGYTLRRAFHEVGGDKRLMLEMDLLHEKPEADLGPSGKGYALLLRLALDGLCHAWIGGPPCRTRSMLRHFPVEGESMPRPLRSWGDGEYGINGLSQFEKEQVYTDDVLLLRFLLLYVISEEVRKANQMPQPTTIMVEQPADLAHMPQVVTLWRTETWKRIANLYHLQTQTFNQSEFACKSTKPTTIGGTMRINVPMPGRRGLPREVEGKTKEELCQESKSLSRWPPLMMREIATSLQVDTMKGEVKMRALSWREHVAAGHTPFRKDCLVCQEASAKDCHHRRNKDPPRVGVLSLDMSGPFRLGTDLNGKKGKYMIIGAFTWLAKGQMADDFEEEKPPEVPEEAPEIENLEPEEADLEDAEDVWGELQEERERKRKEEAEEREAEKEHQKESEEKVEDEVGGEERKIPKVTVTRLCIPLPSKSGHDVLKAIIGMYLRLRSDGFTVNQIHTDRGREFCSEALEKWCLSRTILHTFTPGDQPQSNGRVEASVQWIKAEVRRVLHAAGAPFTLWPLAARNVDERLRLIQVGKQVSLPNFMTPVLIRKRYWRARELLPTQERALYIGPSWVHHGHWIQREDGSHALTRMVMHKLVDPPKDEDWIGLEDELAPVEVRRRIRGKVSLNHFSPAGDAPRPEEEEEMEKEIKEEKEREDQLREVRRVIENEMRVAVDDEETASYLTLDAVAALKEMTYDPKADEILQTRIVAQHEVRRNIQEWIEPIQKELDALFETKKALRPIDRHQVQQLISEDRAEILPSKMVWTVKPSPTCKAGKKKARLVACGNFAERSEADLFAGGATAVALRAAVSIASQHQWCGRVCDIRTAFLNAPMKLGTNGNMETGENAPSKVAIIKPPPLLVMAGLAKPDEYWEVLMALYGYRESPRLWADHRDSEVQRMEVPMEDGSFLSLDQMVTEPNMWRILRHQPGPFSGTQAEQFCGILLIYVDDFLLLGEPAVLDVLISAIQAKWETSVPEEIDAVSGVRFLGAEIFKDGNRWWMTQRNYLQDLLSRNLGAPPWQKRKIPMIADPDTREDPPNHNLETTREAQRVVGELVWVATRTRPDLAFAITKLASLITKDPQLVIDLTKNVWHYLANTMDHGLQFQNQLEDRQLNIYSDASFGEISMGCHLVMWGSSLLLWKAGRQSVATASTAEAELVEVLEGALAGDAIRVVMEEALNISARSVSFTDNTAALSIIAGDTGSWRTRHLKKRAHVLRSRINMGDWLIRHMAGSEIPADMGTKVLASERFNLLKKTMGMFLGEDGKVLGEDEKVLREEGKFLEKRGKVLSERKEKAVTQEINDGRVEVTKTALKALILFAKLVQAKGVENGMQVWIEESALPLTSFARPESGWPFFIIIVMVFCFGLLIGAVMMWLAVYPFFHRVTLVESRSNVVPRPSFLLHDLPENRRNQRSQAPQPRNTFTASTTPSRPSAAAGSSSAVVSDAAAAGSSSAVVSDAAAVGSSSAVVSDAGMVVPTSTVVSSDAAPERQNRTSNPRRRNVPRIPEIPLFVSQMGQKFHGDPNCRGLRNARSVERCARCPDCFPNQTRPNVNVYGLGPGSMLHGDPSHVEPGEVKEYGPCAVCMYG